MPIAQRGDESFPSSSTSWSGSSRRDGCPWDREQTLADARALPHRGGLRGPRGHRRRRRARALRGARRSAVPDRLPGRAARARRQVRHRRRRARHRHQDDAPPSARVRRCQGQGLRRGARQLGQAQGGGAQGEGQQAARARRRAREPAGAACARSASARRRPRSASTGPTSRACAKKSTKSWREIDEAMQSGDRDADRARARRSAARG